MSRFIIGDIHGCLNTFKALIKKLPEDAKITLVADLIDRGPDSAGVIKYVREKGYDCVKGNHEDMLFTAFYSPETDLSCYLRNGGGETLNSYGMSPWDNLQDHVQLYDDVQWIEQLPYYLEYPDELDDKGRSLLISHSAAGHYWHLRNVPGSNIGASLMWNRHDTILPIEGVYNVYGHTPQGHEPLIGAHAANIDTGACYLGFGGVLTALQWPEMNVIQQENIEGERFK